MIEKYSLGELKNAKYQLTPDNWLPYYKALEDRINELEKENTNKRNVKERWKDRLVGAVFTLGVALLISFLKRWLF